MICEDDIKAAETNLAVKKAINSGRVVSISEYERATRHAMTTGFILGFAAAIILLGCLAVITL